ncbi:MAG TPA: DEAD/DEAH box helicase [Mycobacteriales bacterium]|nr:DEAD/DEAH box helicase [Mycobacteriales bacterium]
MFADLGVCEPIVEALSSAGITRAFAIQEMTLPIALAGNDLIGQARTGTGKTLGFGIPLLQRITPPDAGANGTPQALVIVPTRELCVQVTRDLQTASTKRGLRVLPVYGGRAYEPQIDGLRNGVDVVVGTPGRLLDLAQQGYLKLNEISILVLDEADEMLDLGFLPDIERVLDRLPGGAEHGRQTMLFSATMPGPIVTLARRFMHRPVHIRAEGAGSGHTVPATDQHVYRAHPMDKIEVLTRILQAEDRGRTMVFCRTKRTAQKVSDELATRGFAAAAIHGDLGQGAREQGLRQFRSGKMDVLVATDVAARGIDVSGVTHVINYQCPEDEKNYVHRIGRTGRAGATGIAVTFVDWDELHRWQLINSALGLPFAEPMETYSTSEHLFSELKIPHTVTGALAGRAAKPVASDEAAEAAAVAKPGRRRRASRRTKTHAGAPAAASSSDSSKSDGATPRRRRTRGGRSAKGTAAESATND